MNFLLELLSRFVSKPTLYLFHSHGLSQKVLFSVPLTILIQRIALISVSLAFGPHSCASTVNATVGGLPSGSTVCFTVILLGSDCFKFTNPTIFHLQNLRSDRSLLVAFCFLLLPLLGLCIGHHGLSSTSLTQSYNWLSFKSTTNKLYFISLSSSPFAFCFFLCWGLV